MSLNVNIYKFDKNWYFLLQLPASGNLANNEEHSHNRTDIKTNISSEAFLLLKKEKKNNNWHYNKHNCLRQLHVDPYDATISNYIGDALGHALLDIF